MKKISIDSLTLDQRANANYFLENDILPADNTWRPRLYEKITGFKEQMLLLAASGHSQAQICSRLGFSKQILHNWRKTDPLIDQLWRVCVQLCEAYLDDICTKQLNNPDKSFNERLFKHAYSTRVNTLPVAGDAPSAASLADTLASAFENGSLDADQFATAVSGCKSYADIAQLPALEEKITKLEHLLSEESK